MGKVNATGGKRKIWRVLPTLPAEMLVAAAQEAEADGVEGVFAYQVYGPPFIPLAAA
ncbi:MAG: LLM class flavin-dependent oxidoreductase, partial [Proteobacteria bacterium]|nr:LLM class flavin-dependent oxidoreductase [Pseudomonadota bacterium]